LRRICAFPIGLRITDHWEPSMAYIPLEALARAWQATMFATMLLATALALWQIWDSVQISDRTIPLGAVPQAFGSDEYARL